MKKAIGYCRVSTDGQADNGVSLEMQRTKIEAMAEVQGVDLVEVIVDPGESAKNLNRPGMMDLLGRLDRREAETVIVYKLDRLTRSVRDLGDLLDRFERRGVSLVSVSESLDTGSAAGRLVLNVMGAVAQWEREAIGERTREALAAKKAKGERVGNVPFGYAVAEDGSTLVENPDERRIGRRIATLRPSHTLKEIADRLNRAGCRTRTGAKWTVRKVHHLAQQAA